MFTYIDPTIRQRLIEEGKLVKISHQGVPIPDDQAPVPDALSLSVLGPIPLPIRMQGSSINADWYAAVRHTELSKVEALAADLRAKDAPALFASLSSSMAVNSVLIIRRENTFTNPLVRIHSSCLTGDVLGSERCECGPQLHSALTQIDADKAGGMLIYMAGHEGRGIGLWAKAVTYLLQDAGENTYQANESLGLPADSRDFSDAAALIHYFLGNVPFRLLTNNPKKITDLQAHGLNHIEAVKHVIGVGEWNRRYLAAKRDWGHEITKDDLS